MGVCSCALACFDEPGFPQKAARMRGESGKEEISRQRQPRLRRRQAMGRLDPRFRGQVLKIDPHGRPRSRHHRVEIGLRQPATECFDDNIGQIEAPFSKSRSLELEITSSSFASVSTRLARLELTTRLGPRANAHTGMDLMFSDAVALRSKLGEVCA